LACELTLPLTDSGDLSVPRLSPGALVDDGIDFTESRLAPRSREEAARANAASDFGRSDCSRLFAGRNRLISLAELGDEREAQAPVGHAAAAASSGALTVLLSRKYHAENHAEEKATKSPTARP
jgi:hypothetical protein